MLCGRINVALIKDNFDHKPVIVSGYFYAYLTPSFK